MMKTANHSTSPQMIAARTDFKATSMSGRNNDTGSAGQLPPRYYDEFFAAAKESDFYCVRSYQTPIAWFAAGEWYVPDVRYTMTTSKHQSRLYAADPRHTGPGWK